MTDFLRETLADDSLTNSTTAETLPDTLLLSSRELAHELRVAPKTITRLLQTGKLPLPLFIGQQRRWPRTEIVEWIAARAPPRREWDRLRKAAR